MPLRVATTGFVIDDGEPFAEGGGEFSFGRIQGRRGFERA